MWQLKREKHCIKVSFKNIARQAKTSIETQLRGKGTLVMGIVGKDSYSTLHCLSIQAKQLRF